MPLVLRVSMGGGYRLLLGDTHAGLLPSPLETIRSIYPNKVLYLLLGSNSLGVITNC